MPRNSRFVPHARSSGLIITDLDAEVLIYDKERDKAFCLNETSALVWKYSNGKRNVAEIARAMANKLHSPVDEQVVWFALQQLEKDRLMRSDALLPKQAAGISRREFVKKMGMTAVAVTVPAIISMTAPQSAFAQSCSADGANCNGNSQCCSSCCCTKTGTCTTPSTCTALGGVCADVIK